MLSCYYNLREWPFQINSDPRFLWLGEKHKEALATLMYGVLNQRGFLLLTGDVGTGKTTLVNALLEKLDNTILVGNITDPKLDLMGFLNVVSSSLGIPEKSDKKEDFLRRFARFLHEKYAENKYVLLIIDEAHTLSTDHLEQIRLLSNIELPERRLMSIFLVGQDELNQTLTSYECRALRQRITLICRVEPLSEAETTEYIRHRLKIAGTERKLFPHATVREIQRFSRGYPRLINILCDYALVTGNVRELREITPAVIRECSQEMLLPGEHMESSLQALLQNPEQHLPHSREQWENSQSGRKGDETPPLHNPVVPVALKAFVYERFVASYHGLKDRIHRALLLRWQDRRTWFPCLIPHHGLRSIYPTLRENLSRVLDPRSRPRVIYWATGACAILVVLSLAPIFRTGIFSWRGKEKTSLSSNGIPAVQRSPSGSITASAKTPGARTEETEISAVPTLEDAKPKDLPRAEAHSHVADKVQKTGQAGEAVPKTEEKGGVDSVEDALRHRDFRMAIELSEEIMARNESPPPEVRALYLDALLNQAEMLSGKDPVSSEDLLNRAVSLDPRNFKALLLLGKLYTAGNQYGKALEAYQKAADLNPNMPGLFFNLGFLYAAKDDYVLAEKAFARAIELSPPYLDKALFNLAVAQDKQGKRDASLQSLKKALEINPNNQKARDLLERLTGGS
jgi:type II secretory pathway predicted ATPase ExeA